VKYNIKKWFFQKKPLEKRVFRERLRANAGKRRENCVAKKRGIW